MDDNTFKVLSLTIGTVSTLGLAAISTLGVVANANAKKVKTTLAETTAETTKQIAHLTVVGEATHTLVNSNMGAQLRISAVALRSLADITKKPRDVAIADEAERLLADHMAKQAVVDEKGSQ